MLKSSNKARPNSLCKSITGQTFYRVDHASWLKCCNLYWIHFITIAVKICGCHPHPSFTFSLEGFWVIISGVNYVNVYFLTCIIYTFFTWYFSLFVICMRWMCGESFMGPTIDYKFTPPSEVYLSYCNSNKILQKKWVGRLVKCPNLVRVIY